LWFGFWLDLIFNTAPCPSLHKLPLDSKNAQNRPKKIISFI
jgi:hypothetical protein